MPLAGFESAHGHLIGRCAAGRKKEILGLKPGIVLEEGGRRDVGLSPRRGGSGTPTDRPGEDVALADGGLGALQACFAGNGLRGGLLRCLAAVVAAEELALDAEVSQGGEIDEDG